MSYAWANMSYQEKVAQGTGAVVFVMALVFVFLILSAQYESWSLPLSVMLGTPIAVFGAILGLWIARLVQRELRQQRVRADRPRHAHRHGGEERDPDRGVRVPGDAERARMRCRRRWTRRNRASDPILMTAFSFILGVVPLLIASGAGAEARKVMGMTVFSGMLAATIIGVLVVPAMFVFVEKYVSKRKAVEATE